MKVTVTKVPPVPAKPTFTLTIEDVTSRELRILRSIMGLDCTIPEHIEGRTIEGTIVTNPEVKHLLDTIQASVRAAVPFND